MLGALSIIYLHNPQEVICTGGGDLFILYHGLHRIILSKSSAGMACWQSGLSYSQADCHPGGMPEQHQASPSPR